ncbi:MAG: Crp/Fnr family transcriptional regulator [Prevotellaceae bacterium]|nr:Crp/Fnr family transcriptional regulator [Prevotellaceae bacterium]
MQNIINGIRKYYPVSDASLALLFSKMKRLELPKKHLLIRGGTIDRHVYFIEKGFARSYVLYEGKEITIWFSREGDFTFAMQDLYHNKPGYEYVELLEDSILYAIPVKELNVLYETNIEIANWSRIAHQECLLYMDRHHNNRLFLSAKERYEQLTKELPDVVQRANLYYVASYLGITPQHLSRLRARK